MAACSRGMNLKNLVAVIIVILFAALGINNVTDSNNKLHLKNIELKSKATELKTLELKYDNLQIELNRTDKTNKEQIQKLEKEKQDLEKDRQRLEKEVSLKQERQRIASQRLQNASLSAVGSTRAYAAGNGYSGTGDPSLDWIVQRESSGNPYATNPLGACGLFQALPCSKLGCSLSDIVCQIAWGRNYAISRYGSTAAAKQWWVQHSWW